MYNEESEDLAQIISGDYECLEDPYGIGDDTIQYDSESVMDVDGVETTVIVSDATTAMIVDDGSAYLYDTLQDAVNAASRRMDENGDVNIRLLQQPGTDMVKLPVGVDAASITISKLDESSDDINFSEITMTDSSGNNVIVAEDGTLSTTIAVTGVKLDKTSLDLTIGDSATLIATVEPGNATDNAVTWSSSDSAVATVENGKVTALKPGTATITASAGGKTAECAITISWEVVIPDTHGITVTQPANGSIEVNPSNGSAGTLITITATPDKGYTLACVTVDGERITGTNFRMPDKAVTVSAVFVPVTVPFTDVKTGDWFYDYVAYVYSNGFMDGTSATTFEPNANMTRTMVWAILARIGGETVTGANWIDTARVWAMVEGVSDGTDANGVVTREQLATMLWRYAGEPASDFALTDFADASSVSDWADAAMAWAVECGIITGVTDTTLVP